MVSCAHIHGAYDIWYGVSRGLAADAVLPDVHTARQRYSYRSMPGATKSTANGAHGPAWENWLGIVAIVLGVLLAAAQGTELTRQFVIASSTPSDGRLPAAECPEDELIEEGLTRAECEQLVSNVRGFIVSAPPWFPRFQSVLAATGVVLAIVSIVVGAALVNREAWGAAAAVPAFAALALVDAAAFAGAVQTGPILRDLYLWNFLLWFVIHLMMTLGAAAGRATSAETAEVWERP